MLNARSQKVEHIKVSLNEWPQNSDIVDQADEVSTIQVELQKNTK